MSEKRFLPDGQQWINMKGDIKAVANHLAFDRSNQRQMGYFPCDANGVAIEQPTEEEVAANTVKKSPVVTNEIRDYGPQDTTTEKKKDISAEENPYEAGSVEATIYDLHIAGKNADEIKEATGANKNTIKKVVNA